MRILIATPFELLAKISGFIAGVIAGRPFLAEYPMNLDEALEAGMISEEDMKRILRDIESEDDDMPY